MATEEIEISELELAEKLAPDNLIPIESLTDTKATTLQKIKEWLGSFFVGKTGKEAISGEKTFNNSIIRSEAFSGTSDYMIRAVDTNGKGSVAIRPYYTNNIIYNRIQADNTTSGKSVAFDIIVKDNGTSSVNSNNIETIAFMGAKDVLVPTAGKGDNSQRAVNTAWVKAECIGFPNYAGKISTTAETYTCPDNGWLYVQMIGLREANTWGYAYINGAEVGCVLSRGSRSVGDSSIFIPVLKGDVLTFDGNINTGLTKIFYPFK